MSKKTSKSTGFKVWNWHPGYVGLVGAACTFAMSLLPSLLPRPWWLQAIVTGISAAIGYGIGAAISALYRWFGLKEFSVPHKELAWKILKVLLPLFVIVFIFFGIHWQNEVHALVGTEPISFGIGLILVVVVSALLFYFLLAIGRATKRLAIRFRKFLNKHVPVRVSIAGGVLLSAFVVYFVVSGLLIQTIYTVSDAYYGARDGRVPEGVSQPTTPAKSGSPDSFVPWEEIGWQGRKFVSTGPTQLDIESYSGQPAKEPIRAYAGLSSADTAEKRAALAVAELKRTGAFDRKVLVVATATGTGWLDPKAVDSIEYMYQGDTAIVSQQYSYLPSWISFLVDKERAHETGRVLYDAVVEEWGKLPEATRPKLLVYGLSLGAFGSQEAFSGVNNLINATDGALYTGPPNESAVWRSTTDNRDAGSPEWQPIYKLGRSVRFASSREDIINNPYTTDGSRVLFQQNANDPVVWFSFDLIFSKPDWLNETRGRGVSPATRYFPLITFLQIGLDQAIAESAPVGNGHYYVDTTVYAWAAVLPPQGWSVEKSDALQHYINTH